MKVFQKYMQKVTPTELCNMRFDCDIELQRCLDMVIGNKTLIEASMLKPHRTLNCEAAANNLHAFRQWPIIPRGKHE